MSAKHSTDLSPSILIRTDLCPGDIGMVVHLHGVVYADTNKPILPPYVIKRVNGMPIGFIGIVLKETPTIVTPSSCS